MESAEVVEVNDEKAEMALDQVIDMEEMDVTNLNTSLNKDDFKEGHSKE